MPNNRKPQSKVDFIRSLPKGMPIKEVLAKGKATGITFSENYVYKARRGSKVGKTTVKRMSATKVQSKAAFIRALPRTMRASEVVARAKAEGISISDTYVYWARGSAKKKGAARRARTSRKGASVARPIATSTSAEMLLRAVAAEIGLGRAMEILAGERAMVRAVIGG